MITGRASWLLGSLCLLILTLAVSPPAISAAPAKEEAEKPAKKGVTQQPAVRLPAHFASVVSEDQREKILTVQAEFTPQLREKRQALKAVADKRDAAIMKLLKPEQRKQVEQAREEAKARRAAAMAERAKSTTEKNTAEKPAADKSAKADK